MVEILKGKTERETVQEAMERTKGHFLDISEFLQALEILYLLEKLDVDMEAGIISYVE